LNQKYKRATQQAMPYNTKAGFKKNPATFKITGLVKLKAVKYYSHAVINYRIVIMTVITFCIKKCL